MSSIFVAAPRSAAAAAASPRPSATRRLPALRWDGRSSRLFAIGLGNLALGVLTLGIYRFWGATRRRREAWAHQSFLGGRLECAGAAGRGGRGYSPASAGTMTLPSSTRASTASSASP